MLRHGGITKSCGWTDYESGVSLIVLVYYYFKERTRHMKQDTTERHNLSIGCRDILTDILRQGAQEMLAEAIKNSSTTFDNISTPIRKSHMPAHFFTGFSPEGYENRAVFDSQNCRKSLSIKDCEREESNLHVPKDTRT